MSIVEAVSIACRGCGATYELPTYASLNVLRDPWCRAAVLMRSLHVGRCPVCGRGVTIDRDFTFVDWARGQVVLVRPSDEWREFAIWEEVAQTMVTTAFADAPFQPSEALQLRVVFGVEGLRDKLVSWDAELDEIAVELAKSELLATRPELGDLLVTVEFSNRDQVVLSAGEARFRVARTWVQGARARAPEAVVDTLANAVFLDRRRLGPAEVERAASA